MSVDAGDPTSDPTADRPVDRRAKRRQETIEEILGISEAVMTEDGVNALSISEVARRLGVQPPSIYKYFPSLMAVFDALFERGSRAHVEAMKAAMSSAKPGLDSLTKGLEAGGRWALEHRGLAELLFWRPVPSFEASDAAMAPSHEMAAIQRVALRDAVRAGELGPAADSDDALFFVSTLISGVLTQTFANEPGVPWGHGRFTPLLPKLLQLLAAAYPPA